MNHRATYCRKSFHRRLASVRRSAERLLYGLERLEFEEFQGQSMEALKSLLQALCWAIRIYEERESQSKNSPR